MMLTAGLVTEVIAFIKGYSVIYKLLSLLIVFVIFFVIGTVIVWCLDHFDKVNSKAEEVEDDVVEKDADGEIIGSFEGSQDEEGTK